MKEWEFNHNGVFGLSPRSTFWKYLHEAYGADHSLDISVSYKVDPKQIGKLSSDELDFSKSKVIVNGYAS